MATETDRDIIRAEERTGLDDFLLDDPYRRWLEREGVKVIEEFAFADLNDVELGPWERKGGSGAVINIPYPVLTNDSQLIEIKPGGRSEPEHHMYEEIVYVLSGRGATTIWDADGEKSTFEWQKGALFSVPLNCWYEHFNGSGVEPARYLAVTNAPPMMRLFNDAEFIFNTDTRFKGRFGGQEDYFSGNGTLYSGRLWVSNFIPNAPDMPLWSWDERGAGGINAFFYLSGNSTKAHVSEFPVGTYKKAHKHGPGANLVLLSGDAGYSLLWTKEDRSDVRKADWKVGSLVIVPSDDCFHQHFNSGTRRARYLALTPGLLGLRAPRAGAGEGADVSIKEGGRQIEYDDEAPEVLDLFEEECLKHGATPDMRRFFPSRKDFKHELPA